MEDISEDSDESCPNSPQPGTSASFGINPQIAQKLSEEQIKNEERKKKRNEYMRGYRAKKKAQQQTEKSSNEVRKRQGEESVEKHEERKRSKRLSEAKRRAEQTPEQSAARLEADRIAHETHRSQESPEKHAERVESHRIARDERRTEATPEQRQQKLDREKEARNRRRAARRSPHIARRLAIDVEKYYLGEMNVECTHCRALHFEGEKTTRKMFSTCCNSGNIEIPPLSPYPQLLTSLLNGSHADSKEYLGCIRNYNCAFSFVSFGYKALQHRGVGPNTFVIHGAVHHLISQNASVQGDHIPTYSQLYFLDPDEAIRAKAINEINGECSEHMFQQIENLLRQVNPYALGYKKMKDLVEEMGGVDVTMVLVKDPTYDQRRYNLPEQREVCAIFTSGEGNEEDFQRQVKIYPMGEQNKLKEIEVYSHHCDPMTYPLLFPYGDPGWHITLKCDGKRVSILQYYSYRLHTRPDFCPLLHAAKLTQQYCIDAFLKVEAERLNYIRHNQGKLRVETYQGLQDFCKNQAQEKGVKAGRLVILPSSFSGGKRDMQQSYQDAMTMVAVYGKPDLFVTFTCNPKWKEIVETLLPHESPSDRPDVVATVFHLKLQQLLHDIVEKHVLGKVIAYQYVIEFQKRGLPHCHMLFILSDEDKLRDPEDVDNVVCAEIPNSAEDPVLYDIVSKSMMHGPCGALNALSVCMELDTDGKKYCKKTFPKSFCPETTTNTNGYPLYRRREDGRTVVTKKGHVLDNTWVVPYNKYLCKKFNSHINVEVCSSIKSVKYIYKYIYKGHDAAVVKINEKDGTGYYNWDEIQAFVDARYLSAPEAMWRLRQYRMQGRSHTIIRLAVHLPLQQPVYIRDGDTEDDRQQYEAALENANRKLTTLLAYFELNTRDPSARQYLYREIPYHYVATEKTGVYKARQRGHQKILTRMYSVSPKDMERYALKLLLLHVRGATSFEYLRTVNGVLHGTFKAAAQALQLLDDDNCWGMALADAVLYQMPSQLRQLYVAICEFGFPTDPKALFFKFQEQLSEDYFREHGDQEVALNLCLKDLESHFREFSHSCLHYGLPAPKDVDDISDLTVDIQAEREKALDYVSKFNDEQSQAFKQIMDSVDGTSDEKCFFLSGAGGCGKTFLYKALMSTILGRHQRVKAVAPTGLAATLFNGQTVHSGFALPLSITATTVSMIRPGSTQCDFLKDRKSVV